MDLSTENGSLADTGVAAEEKPATTEKSRLAADKNKITPFRPKPALLVDVLPEGDCQTEGLKPAEKPIGKAGDEPQEMLETLLRNAETYALRTQRAKMRWQLATLMTGTLLVSAGLVIGLMTYEMGAGGTQKGRLEIENHTLKDQVSSAGIQIDGLKNEVENLMKHNAEVAGVSQRIATTTALAATIKEEQKPVNDIQRKAAAEEPRIDTSRVEAIKKGKYPIGASRAELVTALGKPDRVYAARNYEQLVYFGRKPGRFWLAAGCLVRTTE